MDPAAIARPPRRRAGEAPPARTGLAGLLRPRPAAARRRPGAVRRHRRRRRRTARRLPAGRADAALVALVRPRPRAAGGRHRSRPRRGRGAGRRGDGPAGAFRPLQLRHRDAPGLPGPGGGRHRPVAGGGSAARRGVGLPLHRRPAPQRGAGGGRVRPARHGVPHRAADRRRHPPPLSLRGAAAGAGCRETPTRGTRCWKRSGRTAPAPATPRCSPPSPTAPCCSRRAASPRAPASPSAGSRRRASSTAAAR